MQGICDPVSSLSKMVDTGDFGPDDFVVLKGDDSASSLLKDNNSSGHDSKRSGFSERQSAASRGGHSKVSYFSVGQEFYDDRYSDNEDEASIADKLDFSHLRVQGRKRELLRLHNIYNFVHQRGLGRRQNRKKGETSVAIIKGLSGTGKSTIVKQFIAELEEKARLPGGPCMPFFIHGKYDELAVTDPFSAIVEAFSRFASLLLSGESEELERIQKAVREKLGSEANTLVTVIPSLKAVFPNQALAKGSRENARNKLRYIFQTFANAISTQKRPVVMFLDDLQWCDSASLELIQALLTDVDLRYFMFIGAYRPDEVESGDELVRCLEAINNIQHLEEVELLNLSKCELNSIVKDVLHRDEEMDTMELTDVIFRKTNGNIFHSIQVMEELQRKGVLVFSRLTFQWEWQLDDFDLENLLSEDVIQAVTEKIMNSHKDLQRVLVLAAYTRSSIDIQTLQQLTDLDGLPIPYEGLLEILDKAVIDGLLTNSMGSKYYSFAHDRIQQAAYAMVPPGKIRDNLRMNLGLRLYNLGTSLEIDDWMLFVAADHLNATALHLSKEDPLFLIHLNLEVGDRAASLCAYGTASKYLGMAMQSLLRLEKPWEEYYETTLRVYRAISEVELCQGHFEVGKGIGQQVLRRGRSLEDKLPTQVAICRAVGREERHMEAFKMSVGILQSLGTLSKSNIGLKIRMVKDFLHVRRYLKNHSDEELVNIPMSNDKKLEMTMELLSVAAYHAYYSGAMVDFLVAILRLLRLSVEQGYSIHSGVAMMGYCLICSNLNDMEGALRFARLARDILTHTKARELECLQIFVVSHWVLAWKEPHEEVIELYELASKSGMEAGDFENGLLSRTAGYHHGFVAGHELAALESKLSGLMEKLKVYKLDSVQVMTVEQLRPIPYLRGTSKVPLDAKELQNFGPVTHSSSENYRLLYGYMARLQLGVYFNEDELTLVMLQKFASLPDFDLAFGTKSIRLCFSSLAYSTLYRKTGKGGYLKKARKFIKQLKGLSKVKGANSWHRCMLMDAHLLAAEGKRGAGIQASYDHAIGAAKRSGHIHDAGLGAQLAAEYFLSMEDDFKNHAVLSKAKDMLVRQYLEHARELYLNWGAVGLVNHLERKYSKYLQPTSMEQQLTEFSSNGPSFNSQGELNLMQNQLFTMPKTINDQPREEGKDELSVLTDPWKDNPEFATNPHTSEGDFPASG